MGGLEKVGGSGEVGADAAELVKVVSGLPLLAAGARGWGYWVSPDGGIGAAFPFDGPGRTGQVLTLETLPRPGLAFIGSLLTGGLRWGEGSVEGSLGKGQPPLSSSLHFLLHPILSA